MKLIVEDEEGRKTVIPLADEEVSIGRNQDNAVRLTERNVSRRHALLVRRNGSVVIEDLNSFNGVRVNGDRIAGHAPIREGDLIQIGDYDLAIERETEVDDANRSTSPEDVESESVTLEAASGSADPTPPLVAPREQRLQRTAVIRSPFNAEQQPVALGQGRSLVPSERPRLVFLNTKRAGRELVVERSEVCLGRENTQADLVVEHRSVSKAHAQLIRDDEGVWRVVDLKSANGVTVNGESYGDAPLSPGDILSLGHVDLRFVGPGERFTLPGAHPGSLRPRTWAAAAAIGSALLIAGVVIVAFRPKHVPVAETQEPPAGYVARQQPPLAPVPVQATPVVPPPLAAAATPVVLPTPSSPPEMRPDKTGDLLAQVRTLVRARRWDKADDKLKEVEAMGSGDATAQKLRDEIDAAKSRETTHASGKIDRRKKSPSAPGVAEPEAPSAESASAPLSKADRHAKAQGAYDEAIGLIGSRDYIAALARLQRAVDLDPAMANAHKLMGICYANLKEPDKGAYHYEQYLRLNPQAHDAVDVKRMLADYYRSRGE